MARNLAKRKATGGARRQVNRLPPERRVADILLAARAVFTEKGYGDALISDIAERAGVVEGSLYRFFANKRDLLVKTVEHWYEDMLAHDGAVSGHPRHLEPHPFHGASPSQLDPTRSRAEPSRLSGAAPGPRLSQDATVSSQP